MNRCYPFGTNAVWKGSLIVISYFLLAACMQHDESLSPRALENSGLSKVNANKQGEGPMMKRTFTAHLAADNELPTGSVESLGQGQAIFTVSEDGTVIHYKLIVANIDNVTMAHIHCGAVDESGAPLAWLFGPHEGVTVNGVLAEGDITSEEFISRPDGGSCPGGSANFANLIERLRNGTAYVNVHTHEYGGGEIRGQIH